MKSSFSQILKKTGTCTVYSVRIQFMCTVYSVQCTCTVHSVRVQCTCTVYVHAYSVCTCTCAVYVHIRSWPML
jgi:hypothetical protein